MLKKDARFSPCGNYRYAFWGVWDDSMPLVAFIGLNPTRVDAQRNNPTINRCIGFARAWGYGGVCLVNLFAYLATTPQELMQARDPVGPDNDAWLEEVAGTIPILVAAWGNDGTYLGRSAQVRELIPDLQVLKLNKSGEPAHPLYLKGDLTPVPWQS